MSAYQEISDFIQGQKDCHEGIPHREGMSEDYTRGYRCQYEAEQVKAERAELCQ